VACSGRRGVCFASPGAAASLTLPAHDGARRREPVAVTEHSAAQRHARRVRGRRAGSRGCAGAATWRAEPLPRGCEGLAS
jgi:hypothetical protein